MSDPIAGQPSVFLNVPYDIRYQPRFVTLISTLVSIGQTPRCVVEIPERGSGRLQRIYALLASCHVSIHDLSRVGTPARFNMPFELGLAWALRAGGAKHDVLVLDTEPYRLDKTLSDYKGHDPLIYRGRLDDLVEVVAGAIVVPKEPKVEELQEEARLLRKIAKGLQGKQKDLFRPAAINNLVAAAGIRAKSRGWI